MPIAPVAKLTKKKITWLATHRCEAHGHTFLEHYNCYTKENVEEERIGFLDLETSNLNADYGMILTYCILDSRTDEILHGEITPEDIADSRPGREDTRVVKQLLKDLEKFDKVVTYYGARFDLPFLRTRAIVDKVPFLTYGALNHRDCWFTVRGKFKISSNRLENACRVILGKTRKTRITSQYWNGATRGEAECIAYVLQHNKYDVLDLRDLFYKIEDYARPNNNSI